MFKQLCTYINLKSIFLSMICLLLSYHLYKNLYILTDNSIMYLGKKKKKKD